MTQRILFNVSKEMSAVLELARELIRCQSITPDDAGCQDILAGRLEARGFTCRRLRFGEVDNLWARRGSDGPLLAFAGHTDVVPPGDTQRWTYPPFSATVADGKLWGRGAADMKGALAAMVCALEHFASAYADHPGSVALLVTGSEERFSPNGVRRVVQWLAERNELPEWCVIGEPSSSRRIGDQIRHGRRGSLTCRLKVHGTQGHVAYPQLADNPIHRLVRIIKDLTERTWDVGDANFPPTTLQVTELNAGTGADNVIPPEASTVFNFRHGPALTAAAIKAAVEEIAAVQQGRTELDWDRDGDPFITHGGPLVEAVKVAVADNTGRAPALSTGGGTSDGRFIAPAGVDVVELGTINATIHAVDEHVHLTELEGLEQIYRDIISHLLFRS